MKDNRKLGIIIKLIWSEALQRDPESLLYSKEYISFENNSTTASFNHTTVLSVKWRKKPTLMKRDLLI
jgi:hypothetical protein